MNTKEIESMAQKIWEEQEVFGFRSDSEKPKYYVLDMFPYPSGDGLHVGHIKGYFATDITSNYMRLKGYNVLHPMGWDAFGLPAENYAIKVKKNPREIVKTNIKNFKSQMKMLGLSYDWNKEINTTDPEYYKWTQWIFLKMYEKGLAYQDDISINFCPSCKTGLANEEVVSGGCERCHTKVIKKKIRQWVLRITKYADRLLEDLEGLDWPEPIKEMQRNWIGKSEGSKVIFETSISGVSIEVFTTRIDTLYGCNYIVVSPEYNKIAKFIENSKNADEINRYIKASAEKTDIERSDLSKEKTGIKIEGVHAINPANGEKVSVWVADYVLSGYGTGAVMAVPAHDERDFEFANKYGIEIREVVVAEKDLKENNKKPFIDYGYLINSSEFSGMSSEEASKAITEKLKSSGSADFTTNYKLRDWIFSRQRYWGEPIPLVHCEKCGIVPVNIEDLPVKLPEIESYEPTGTGESPLALIDEWVNTKCPKCGGAGKRETNTMPQWAGSCWYYLRFIDPKNDKSLIDKDLEKKTMPVDLYVGGAEHAVLHLLYARFWHKFLYDIGSVTTKEPFMRLRNVGLIMAQDGQKMSKSRGNVINPDDLVEKYGADALRLYEMFIGPFEKPASWNKNGISGTYNLVKKIYDSYINRSKECFVDCRSDISRLSASISRKIESMQFNTIVSDIMKFSNNIDLSKMDDKSWREFVIIIAPLMPHTSEYLWNKMGNKESVFLNDWPKVKIDSLEKSAIIVQVDGKKRAMIELKIDTEESEARQQAIKNLKDFDDSKIKQVIYIKNKVINFVTK